MDCPALNSDNIWDIYQELLSQFEWLDNAADFIEECKIYLAILDAQTNNEEGLAPIGKELNGGPEHPGTDGAYYMGGVNNGLELGEYLLIWPDHC